MASRIFFAIVPDKQAIDAICAAQKKLASRFKSLRWAKRQNLHITLKFIASARDGQIAEICETAARIAAATNEINYRIAALQPMPPRGQTKMLWAQIICKTDDMTQLAGRLNAELAPCGIAAEARAFTPHITLARTGRGKSSNRCTADALAKFNFDKTIEQQAKEMVLFESKLTPEGPIYTKLATFTFKAGL